MEIRISDAANKLWQSFWHTPVQKVTAKKIAPAKELEQLGWLTRLPKEKGAGRGYLVFQMT
jgi:hypothetical protein